MSAECEDFSLRCGSFSFWRKALGFALLVGVVGLWVLMVFGAFLQRFCEGA